MPNAPHVDCCSLYLTRREETFKHSACCLRRCAAVRRCAVSCFRGAHACDSCAFGVAEIVPLQSAPGHDLPVSSQHRQTAIARRLPMEAKARATLSHVRIRARGIPYSTKRDSKHKASRPVTSPVFIHRLTAPTESRCSSGPIDGQRSMRLSQPDTDTSLLKSATTTTRVGPSSMRPGLGLYGPRVPADFLQRHHQSLAAFRQLRR